MFQTTDNEIYKRACQLRTLGDRQGDPEKYRQAASLFRELDMQNAAASCERRAKYYENKETK